jgi:hypothetical protein
VEGGTGIGDFRLPIFPPWRADGHWKELPHHFFSRQSSITNRQSPIVNHQSSIGNRQSAIANRRSAIKTKAFRFQVSG